MPAPTVPASAWPSIAQAEDRIHDQANINNIAIEVDPDFYKDTHVGWHPLKDEWALALNPSLPPEKKTVGEICALDCKEREKNRKRECAEIRKRVQQKLKEIGCLSKVISTDKGGICPKRTVKKAAVVVPKKKKGKAAK